MNTTGIQNYLSNVFRPIYTYDSTTFNFTPRLELSNIDTYSGNSVNVFTAAVGDSNDNVYVGRNAGNPYNFLQACRNVTALGVGAAASISNDSNCVYVGYYAGQGSSNADDVISIGADSGGNGDSNIFIGSSTGTVGNSNILIGHRIDPVSASNQIRIGYSNQIPIAADLCLNWVGLGGPLTPVDVNNNLDISGNARIQGQLGINILPGGRTLDVNGNFRAADAFGTLDFSNAVTRSTGGFVSLTGSNVVSNTSNVSIGTLKKGIVIVSVSSGTTNFDGRTSFVLDTTTPVVSNLSSNKSATTTVNFTTNSINISNTTGGDLTYTWAITYFPMP